MIVITDFGATASAVKLASIVCGCRPSSAALQEKPQPLSHIKAAQQDAQINCCCVKLSRAEECFTNSHTKIDKRSTVRKPFFCHD